MKILLCSWTLPYPTDIGGRQRTNLLYRALTELGDVDCIYLDSLSSINEGVLDVLKKDFGCIANAPMTHASERGLWRLLPSPKGASLNRIAHNLDSSRSLYKADSALLEQLSGKIGFEDYDIIVGRYAKSLAKLGLPNGKVPVLLDIDDLDSDVYASRLNEPGNSLLECIVLKMHLRAIQRRLPKFLKRVDHCMVANSDNLDSPGVRSASVLPNIPFSLPEIPEPAPVDPSYANTIMVIGSYNHPPNRLGVEWFLEHVWQIILKRLPVAEFCIYGSSMTDSMKESWGSIQGVRAIGFVESVADAYRDCALSICPVGYGAGTNIKVLESFAYGRQCVLTQAAARGFCEEACFKGMLSIASDADQMAEQIVTKLQDESGTAAVSSRLQKAVRNYYSRAAFNRAVAEGVEVAIKNFGES